MQIKEWIWLSFYVLIVFQLVKSEMEKVIGGCWERKEVQEPQEPVIEKEKVTKLNKTCLPAY